MVPTPSEVAKTYTMPKIELGRVVLWSFNRGGEKVTAFVTRAGTTSVNLDLHVDGVKDHVMKTGVRHVSDPFLAKFPQHEAGCWDYTDFDKRVMALLENFEDAPTIEVE